MRLHCRLRFLLPVILIVSSTTPLAAQDRPRAPVPDGVRVLRDVEYVPGGHERQRLDLYLPAKPRADGPMPLIIWIHGGAWMGGDKNNCPAVPLVRRGYAVASVGYRLSGHAVFPAQVHDCKAAVRWLRANAREHGIDPRRFGAWGPSAGGHLVALLGTSGDVKELEGDLGEHRGVSSRVQCVVDWYGPSDLTAMARQAPPNSRIDHDAPGSPESRLVGGPIQQNKDKAAKANPIAYVTKDDPPFLVFHGTKDNVVPLGQSEMLVEALKQAGVDVEFVPVEGAGHGGPEFNTREVRGKVEEFFEKRLGKRRE